jgi:hypothetical protein
MIKCYLLIVTIVLCISTGNAQKQNNIWYFGEGAGLDFRSGSPKVLTDSKISTWEGCDVICDDFGNLLLYSDGVSVWNRKHEVMPNGTGLNGNKSSTQSVAIIPKPDDDSTYIIFTTDDYSGFKGFSYSIVDLRLEGGLGDVIIKNIELLDDVTEKVTIIKHANNYDFWILTHKWDSDEYYAYLITSAGIISNLTVTKIGSIYSGFKTDKVGCLRASQDGKLVASVAKDYGFVELFNFNNFSGTLSNARKLESSYLLGAYGLEFSNDNSKLYVSMDGKNVSNLYQLDLSLGSDYEIVNNMVNLSFFPSAYHYGTLQMGPDGKIYVAKWDSNYLGVISNPDGKGNLCNYIDEGIFLEGKTCKMGLPQSIQYYDLPEVAYDYTNPVCVGDIINFIADTINGITYKWSGPAGFKSVERYSSISDVKIENEGKYKLEITYANGSKKYYSFIINIIDNKFKISNASDSDFGKLCPGKSIDKTFFIENTGTDTIRLESITPVNTNGIYSVITMPPLGSEIEPGDTTILIVTFKPLGIRIYDDEILVKTANPCSSEKSFSVLGTGSDKTYITIPDTVCLVGDNNFRLPLYAKLDCASSISGSLSYEAEIKVFADAFAVSENNPLVSAKRIENGELIINLKSGDISISDKKTLIGEIAGTILIPNLSINPVDITFFKWNNSLIETDTNGGSLIITGNCHLDKKKISAMNPQMLKLYPNPTDGIIKLETPDNTQTDFSKAIRSIQVLDCLGRACSKNINKRDDFLVSKNSEPLIIDISENPSGVYYIIVNVNDWNYIMQVVKI